MGLIKMIIDIVYDYEFGKKFRNPYTEQARQTVFYSTLYKTLNTDSKQANREQKEQLKKLRGF